MKVVSGKADLVDLALLLESPGIKQRLKDALVVTSLKVLAVTPSILCHPGALNLCVCRTAESINALMHCHIVLVNLAYKFDSHRSIFGEIFRYECVAGTAIVARRIALRGIECFTKVSEYLSASAVSLVFAILNHRSQHVAQSLLLLSAAFAFVDHLS